MREILFRGKRKNDGKWVEGYYAEGMYYLNGEQTYMILPLDLTVYPHCEFSSYEHVDPKTVGQYTGLVDKNGKKIFEGDIMRNAGNVVGFCCGDYCINGDSPLDYWTKTEIIGNIHDNPELAGLEK